MFEDREKLRISRSFWHNVKKRRSGCWEWMEAKSNGYGKMTVGKYNLKMAHRVSYALHHGGPEALIAGQEIAHLCHNRACVNPAHLKQCSRIENVHTPGGNGRSKITEDAVREIRREAIDLDGECAMMLKHRISQVQIQAIVKRRFWKHVQ